MTQLCRAKTHGGSETRSNRRHSYLVVVGVETEDDVDADDVVDTELEVDALIGK